jgi:hypothetical protein
MKKNLTVMVRACLVAGLGLAVCAGAADAAGMSGRQCKQDWRTHRATYRQQGKTRRIFMRECRAGTMAAPAPAPAQPAPETGTAH